VSEQTIEIDHGRGVWCITVHRADYMPGEDATHDSPGSDDGAYYEVSYFFEDEHGTQSSHGIDPCDLPGRVIEIMERQIVAMAREASCVW